MFSFAGGANPDDTENRRVTIYPLYFQQRSANSNENYAALIPFYGHLKNRLMRDDIFFTMFPLYSETRKRDIVTDNYLFPFFDVQHGDGEHGWQFWPLFGARHKVVTTVTNGFGDTEIVAGYDRNFWLWPIHFRQNNDIGTPNAEKLRADLPLYSYSRSPQRDATSVIWPFFNWIDDREKKYREWQGPYPFVDIARGEGKTTTRVFPLFSRAHNDSLESDFYLWPLYRYNRIHAGALDQERTRVLFYLFSDVIERNTNTAAAKQRVAVWPLFTWRSDFNGNRRLQLLAPIEPVLHGQPRRGTQLVAALVAVARRGQSADRRQQPVAPLEPLPQRPDAGHKKMLAPVRPFPVSIRREDEQTAVVFHPGGPFARNGAVTGEVNYVSEHRRIVFAVLADAAGAAAGVAAAAEGVRPVF